MKKILLVLFMLLFALFIVTGCDEEGNTTGEKETKKEVKKVTANTKVGNLNYYVPSTYKYYPEFRGLIYTEDERKIYALGDFADYSTLIVIDVFYNNSTDSLDNYVNNINTNNLKDGDVKFVKKDGSLNVYGREEYESIASGVERINYAYLLENNNKTYAVSVYGPKIMSDDVSSMASDVLSSLSFEK